MVLILTDTGMLCPAVTGIALGPLQTIGRCPLAEQRNPVPIFTDALAVANEFKVFNQPGLNVIVMVPVVGAAKLMLAKPKYPPNCTATLPNTSAYISKLTAFPDPVTVANTSATFLKPLNSRQFAIIVTGSAMFALAVFGLFTIASFYG
jgi:hypothetical protein